jgi:hypothetical protein
MRFLEEPRGTSWEASWRPCPAVFDDDPADHGAVTRFRNGIESRHWRARGGSPNRAVALNGVVHLPRVMFLDTLRLIAILASLA